jgi:hypothetical protein
VGVCNHIYHLLILYCVSSRLVTLPKIVDAHIRVSDMLYVTVSCRSICCILQVFVLFLKSIIRLSKGGNQRIAVFNTKRNGENMWQEWNM